MSIGIRVFTFFFVASALISHLGCSEPPKQTIPQKTEVAIQDFKPLVGKWGGLLRFEPRLRKDDYVKLTIEENGKYHFTSVRVIGVLTGTGFLVIEDGKASANTLKGGNLTFTLFDRDGESVLSALGVSHRGEKARAELIRIK